MYHSDLQRANSPAQNISSLAAVEQEERKAISDAFRREVEDMEVDFITQRQSIHREELSKTLEIERSRNDQEAQKRRLTAQRVSLIQNEQQLRSAMDRVEQQLRTDLRIQEQKERHKFGVPRLSGQPRAIPQGSATALIHRQIRAEHREREELSSALLPPISHGRQQTSSSSSTTHELMNTAEDPSSVAHLDGSLHVHRLAELCQSLRRDKLYKKQREGEVSWGSNPTLERRAAWQARILRACTLLQRVGRGYLLRNASSSTHDHNTQKHRSLSSRGQRRKMHSVQSTSAGVEVQKLMNTYNVPSLSVVHDANSSTSRSPSKHEVSKNTTSLAKEAGMLHKSASTLFLKRTDITKPKPSARETIQRSLLEVEQDLKRKVEILDKRTRELQREQDLKMLELAEEDAKAKERRRQLMAGLRERARILRLQLREEDRNRELEANLRLKDLSREFDIKRVELHVELRQKYMQEDRVSALRKTLNEVSSASHLSATVPSLNLTLAMKQALQADKKSLQDP